MIVFEWLALPKSIANKLQASDDVGISRPESNPFTPVFVVGDRKHCLIVHNPEIQRKSHVQRRMSNSSGDRNHCRMCCFNEVCELIVCDGISALPGTFLPKKLV